MRKIVFGSYDTWTDWGLTLTGWKLSDPEYKSNFVSVPGRDGDLDLSTALTDGQPRYKNRNLTSTFERSTGTREERQRVFDAIVNALDGRRVNIILPDDDMHFITGRLHVAVDYNDLAHGALKITGICEPWRQAAVVKTTTLKASSKVQTTNLTNDGRRLLVPTVVVSGAGASVALTFGTSTWTLAGGTYNLPDMQLQAGDNSLSYSGTGTVQITRREAVL